jgi:hypothetical protein
MRNVVAVVAFSVLLVGAASAQERPHLDTVSLAQGEAITIEVDAATNYGATLVERGEAAPPEGAELAMIQELASGAYDDAIGKTGHNISTPDDSEPLAPIQPNVLRLRFVNLPGTDHSVLLVENGYDRAFGYRAVMHVRGHGSPTDVCLVRSHLRGIEHWPYAIESIDLSSFRLVPWRDGQQVTCQ